MRRIATAALAALAFGACTEADQPITAPEVDALTTIAADGFGESSGYSITIENLTVGQPFTPPLAVTHRAAASLFTFGEAASTELQQIAENGNLAPALGALEGAKHTADLAVAVAGEPSPLMPGQSVTFDLDTESGARQLSFVAMLICTNDGFTGVDGLKLPERVGESVSMDLYAFDAGTELNTESFDDLVPPCPPLTGVPSESPGSGMSNPALAQNGVVDYHPGVAGTGDLDPSIHGWTGAVGRITVERLN